MENATLKRCVLDRVNELPTPTWNHLDINAIQLEVPRHVSARGLEEAALAASGSEVPCGMGADATVWLEASATDRRAVEVAPGSKAQGPIVVDLAREDAPVQVLDVRLGAGSSASLALLARRPADPAGEDASDDGEGGSLRTCGWTVRATLGAGAHLDVYALVTAPGWQVLDNFGAVLGDDARLEVKQFYLDGEVMAGGLCCELRGDCSAVGVDSRYLGRDAQVVDIGHVVRQCGRRTECDLAYRGVLTGDSSKTLRDTIDLVRGCKGSRGSENETVLLAGEGVGNRSLPVILCGEDDVAGDHGATVGELGAAERGYLASRGLAADDIPALVMESTFEAAFSAAHTEAACGAVLASAARVLGEGALEDLSVY